MHARTEETTGEAIPKISAVHPDKHGQSRYRRRTKRPENVEVQTVFACALRADARWFSTCLDAASWIGCAVEHCRRPRDRRHRLRPALRRRRVWNCPILLGETVSDTAHGTQPRNLHDWRCSNGKNKRKKIDIN